MRWKRYIIHADLNHCYAQIEEMLDPRLRTIPMAVGGDETKRHGIILAKNDKARAFGVRTGESLREALRKCPKLYIVKACYDKYLYYTSEVKSVYQNYSDRVESFGLDEAWIDISDSFRLFGDPLALAKRIQDEVFVKFGLTVSMGVSFNKIFAKLGSDMDKEKGFVIISPTNYKEMIYRRPIGDLLYVGEATKRKLNLAGIFTIGDLAALEPFDIEKRFGKNGVMLWRFARGYDESEVERQDHKRDIKSLSNGITAVRDLETFDDVKMILSVLAQSLASRLRDIKKEGKVVTLMIRDSDLNWSSRQTKLPFSTDIETDILKAALKLAEKSMPYDHFNHLKKRYRSLTLKIADLKERSAYSEYDLFGLTVAKEKERALEMAIDEIHRRFGFDKCQRLLTKMDKELTDFNPKGEHVIHPESWF